MKISTGKFIFLLLSIFGICVSAMVYFILPERFFLDTNIYIIDPYNEIGYRGGYPLTILFYKITGLKNLHFSIIGVIQYLVLIYVLLKIGIPAKFGKLNLKNSLVYISFIILAIFLSMPTKEFITYLFTALIVLLFKSQKYSIAKTAFIGVAMLVFFAIMFRPYYVLIAIIGVSIFLMNKIKFKNRNTLNILFGLFVLITMSLSYGVVKGEYISQNTRENLNEKRIEKNPENSKSMIVSPIKQDSWYGESVGIIYGFFSVNLPFNAVKHITSPQIIFFSLWQLMLFAVLFVRYGRCFNQGLNGNYEIWLFYFLFSYFIVQGVFEPDLGSAIRHKAGIFPLIYYVLYYEDFRKKLS